MKNPETEMLFLNRDHLVCVRIRNTLIAVTTTVGEKINISALDTTAVERFADDLANDIQSNLVSVTVTAKSSTA
jgi:hypothetical protein